MSNAGSFTHIANQLIKELSDASRFVVEVRLPEGSRRQCKTGPIEIISVNGCTTVNSFSHYVGDLTTRLLEDNREYLSALPDAERGYFLDQLIPGIRSLCKVVLPEYLSYENQGRTRQNVQLRKGLKSSLHRGPRRCHPQGQLPVRWYFRSITVVINGPCGISKSTGIKKDIENAVIDQAWKFSTAWSLRLCYMKQMLEEIKKIIDWMPVNNLPVPGIQVPNSKLPVMITRDVLAAYFRILKETGMFGNTPSGEICKMIVSNFSTKGNSDLKLKRLRNVFDVPTEFGLQCCSDFFRTELELVEKLMLRYHHS
ncbi:MAG: hypothetical protein NT040_08745 [Bacteroidetes bacterium]|nr:hypothetical protein [Bacteroidota bacterium]